jgi:hypothetical protein
LSSALALGTSAKDATPRDAFAELVAAWKDHNIGFRVVVTLSKGK